MLIRNTENKLMETFTKNLKNKKTAAMLQVDPKEVRVVAGRPVQILIAVHRCKMMKALGPRWF